MSVLKTRTLLALGLSGAISAGTAQAGVAGVDSGFEKSIVALSSPDLRVTMYDGIVTLFGRAGSEQEAYAIEQEIGQVEGVDHVLNLITWE